MKKIILLASVFTSVQLMAQQKTVTQAVVNTTTTIVAPDGAEDIAQIQNQGDGRMMMRNFGDGETKSVTYLKDNMVKTVIKTDMGRSTIIRDNAEKKTTTLIEMMGTKTGFYQTDEEAAAMRKQMDSMMKARSKDTSTRAPRSSNEHPVDIVETGETKKIAGYNAKKAYVVTSRLLGLKDSSVVWYTPDIKLTNLNNTGGFSAFGSMGGGAGSMAALSKIDGFVLRYETKMRNNRTMTVEVTKVEIDKDIAAREFEIPKDFEVKPMKEMQNMMQGRGGPGGASPTIMIRQ
jgi:GLPGLI family protein